MLKGASPSTPVPPKMRPCSRRSEDETDVESQLVEGVDGEVCLAKELSQEPNAKLVMLRVRQGVFVPGLVRGSCLETSSQAELGPLRHSSPFHPVQQSLEASSEPLSVTDSATNHSTNL